MHDSVMILGEVFAARRLDVHYSAEVVTVYREQEKVHIHQLNSEKDVVRVYNITVNNTSSLLIGGTTIKAEHLRRYLNNQPIEVPMHTKIVNENEVVNKVLTFGDLSVLDAFTVNDGFNTVYMKSHEKNSIVIRNDGPHPRVGVHRSFADVSVEVKRVDLTLLVG